MFVDRVRIYVRSGRGGNGCVSFRREKYIPYGGPDGGNGGKGGDVYLRANPNITTLYDFTRKPHYKAEDGQHGKGKNMHGKNGKDLYIEVPCGTVVYKIDENGNKLQIADLVSPGDSVIVAKGGRGGRGNAEFKSSTNRAPRIAELGQPGEYVILELELKLIADVGIIGLPNAGKSTLLSVMTSARPKIADYPFTTLSPNLGVCDYHGFRFVLADIPGLIEGAHMGKGLGTEFLRHIERTKVLLHLIDIGVNNDAKQIYKNYKVVMRELEKYSPTLVDKPMIIALNKIDLLPKEKVKSIVSQIVKKVKNKYPVVPISAIKKQNIEILVKEIVNKIKQIGKVCTIISEKQTQSVNQIQQFVYQPNFCVEKQGNKFIVKGKQVEDLVKMTDFNSKESVQRLQRILKKIGVEKMLKKYNIRPGDKVVISDIEFSYIE